MDALLPNTNGKKLRIASEAQPHAAFLKALEHVTKTGVAPNTEFVVTTSCAVVPVEDGEVTYFKPGQTRTEVFLVDA